MNPKERADNVVHWLDAYLNLRESGELRHRYPFALSTTKGFLTTAIELALTEAATLNQEPATHADEKQQELQ